MASSQDMSLKIPIHHSALGHIIGKNGNTIRNLRKSYNVSIYNAKNNGQTKHTIFYIKGEPISVLGVVKEIKSLVDISNKWCKENNIEYE